MTRDEPWTSDIGHRTPTVKKTIKPPALKTGDTIGIAAPAGPVDSRDFKRHLSVLETSGFHVRTGPHLYDRKAYLAGDDAARLSDLHALFKDKGVQAVFCARGGYGTMRLLSGIDYDLILDNPKILVGYSDVTALLSAIFKKTGLTVFHGPMVQGFADKNETTRSHLFQLLSSDCTTVNGDGQTRTLFPGKAAGRLMGGNLTLLCHLSGTPYFPDLEQSLLFIEDRGESLYRIDRMLTHLGLSGRLEQISGLIAGRFEQCGDADAIDQLLKDRLAHLNIPVLTGFPSGHGQDNLAWPLGINAELDAVRKTIKLLEPCVSP